MKKLKLRTRTPRGRPADRPTGRAAAAAAPPRRGAVRQTPGRSVIQGVTEAIAWARGEDVPVRERVVHVPQVDVRAIRRGLHLSQAAFAAKYGFAVDTVQNWEQGRRQPEVPARILLALIERRPDIVEQVLAASA